MGARRDELINKLDLARLANIASTISGTQFQQLAQLSVALENRKDELINKLDLAALAKTSATVHFSQLITSMNSLGTRKQLFIDKLIESGVFEVLAERIINTPYDKSRTVFDLFSELGERKSDLIKLLDFDRLIENSKTVVRETLPGLQLFLSILDEDNRNRLIREIDWASLCTDFPINIESFESLGRSIKNAWRQSQLLLDNSGVERISQYLHNHKNDFIQVMMNPAETLFNRIFVAGIASLLAGWNYVAPTPAHEIANAIIKKCINDFYIRSHNYVVIAQMINAFFEIDPKLSALLLSDVRVQRRITYFIKTYNWSEETRKLRFLIKAIYRSSPGVWHRMAEDSIVSLAVSPLDLDSLYKEVEEDGNLKSSLSPQAQSDPAVGAN